jgi:hypothetical protein
VSGSAARHTCSTATCLFDSAEATAHIVHTTLCSTLAYACSLNSFAAHLLMHAVEQLCSTLCFNVTPLLLHSSLRHPHTCRAATLQFVECLPTLILASLHCHEPSRALLLVSLRRRAWAAAVGW